MPSIASLYEYANSTLGTLGTYSGPRGWGLSYLSSCARSQRLSSSYRTIFVSPTPSEMLPPTVPTVPYGSNSGSTPSSLSRKRQRDDSDTSTASKFSVPTHNKLRRLYGNLCWHCGAEAVIQSCHVIAQKDGSVRISTIAC